MDIVEILLPPLYFLIIAFIAGNYSGKRKKKDDAYKYFMPGLFK